MITECPICGGRIQATAEAYYDSTILNDDFTVANLGDAVDHSEFGQRVYCQNDHTLFEMMAHAHVEKQNGIQ